MLNFCLSIWMYLCVFYCLSIFATNTLFSYLCVRTEFISIIIMTKRKLLLLLILAIMPLSSICVYADPSDIDLQVGYDDPLDEGGIHRSPIAIPCIGIEGYTLTFFTPCDGCLLQLLSEDNEVVYSTIIPSNATTLVLPSYLSGTYEIQIIQDNICFWGDIEL